MAETKAEQLKKCMCGGKTRIMIARNKATTKWKYKAICNKCLMASNWYNSKAEAITAWETRPLEAELAGALEKIEISSYPGLAVKESTLLNRIYNVSTQALAKYRDNKK